MRTHLVGLEQGNSEDVTHFVAVHDVAVATLRQQCCGDGEARRLIVAGAGDEKPLLGRREGDARFLDEFCGIDRLQENELDLIFNIWRAQDRRRLRRDVVHRKYVDVGEPSQGADRSMGSQSLRETSAKSVVAQ
jgi:hypothetical protein